MSVSAIIMAAGFSIRMNQDKLKMKIKEKSMYQYIFERIYMCSKCFKEVIVVAKDDDILKKSLEMGFKAVLNDKSHLGQSQSIKLGILNCSDSGYMFFTADQPFISEETIKELVSAFEKNPNNIIVPCYNGICKSPAIFPKIYKKQLLMLSGDTGGKVIIKDNQHKLIKVNIQSEDELIDIDTMEDYRRVCIERGD